MENSIKKFLNEKIDELDIIKNQYDLAFKDRTRLRIIKDFAEQQLKDIEADLSVVKETIDNLDNRYREYRKNNKN
jgi:hypothetical protein